MGRWSAAALLLALALPSGAATISGFVRDEDVGGNPFIAGAEVRVWVFDPSVKSLVIAAAGLTDGAGHFSIGDLPAATYFVDARGGPPVAGGYTDRWYDVAPPQPANLALAGFIGAYADPIALGASDSFGLTLLLKHGGGLDGTVTAGGSFYAGLFVRAQLAADSRVHHNDRSQADPHPGEFHFRGLLPGATNLITYSQDGLFEAVLRPAPDVIADVDRGAGNIALTSMNLGTDAWNGGNADLSLSYPLARGVFFTSAGALIAPRNAGDVDGFCFNASPGDRFQLGAGALDLGLGNPNPWIDTVLRFVGPGIASPLFDDDSGGGLDSLIADTGELSGGRYCAQVSTFGDTGWNGRAQGSSGRFLFQARLLNRTPRILGATVDGGPAPTPPGAVMIVEGGTVEISVAFSDADADPVAIQAVLVDAHGGTVLAQPLPQGGGAATFAWTAPQDASTAGPYTVTFTATDAPTDAEAPRTSPPLLVNIAVAAVAVPQQIAPADGARVTTATPALEIQDLIDNTQTDVSYQFELSDGAGALLAQSGTIPQDPSGHMAYVTPPLPENLRVAWRVRALHGAANPAHSAWSAQRQFLVDVQNDPPPEPSLVKPANGEEVLVRQPGFAAASDPDPEGDAVSLIFQLATDVAFGNIVEQSAPAGVTLANRTTPWTPEHLLAWGGTYSVRAYAVDALGAQSGFSNRVTFSVRPDALPATPALVGVFATQCHGGVLRAAPPSFVVGNVQDPDREPVTLELQLSDFAADPAAAGPLLDVTQPQSAGDTTALDVSTMRWTEDAHYQVRVRAGDGTAFTPWSDCDFTLDQVPSLSDAGTDGGDAGAGLPDAGLPPDGAHRSGCACRSTDASGSLLLFGALALFLKRRRQ